jgi:hypothetical protein
MIYGLFFILLFFCAPLIIDYTLFLKPRINKAAYGFIALSGAKHPLIPPTPIFILSPPIGRPDLNRPFPPGEI